jgi:hypothetical protein
MKKSMAIREMLGEKDCRVIDRAEVLFELDKLPAEPKSVEVLIDTGSSVPDIIESNRQIGKNFDKLAKLCGGVGVALALLSGLTDTREILAALPVLGAGAALGVGMKQVTTANIKKLKTALKDIADTIDRVTNDMLKGKDAKQCENAKKVQKYTTMRFREQAEVPNITR